MEERISLFSIPADVTPSDWFLNSIFLFEVSAL